MARWIPRTLALLGLIAGIAGCMKPKSKTFPNNGDDASGSVASSGGSATQSRPQLVTIPVSVERGVKASGFSLTASATAFTISLEGCASGYTSSADQDSTALQVYRYDRGCIAKLTEFEFNAQTFAPTVADPFTTWTAGDTATFDVSGGDGSDAVFVKVVGQLADPISGTESVIYQFSALDKGADEDLLAADSSAGHALNVDQSPPPSFDIVSVALVDINAQGAGIFDIVLDCTGDMGGTQVCEDVDMEDIDFKLVEDTFSSNLTIADANTIFGSAGTAVTAGDFISPGDSGTVNGGFLVDDVAGLDEMANHPNMILILRAGLSYQYFNIDVETLTQD